LNLLLDTQCFLWWFTEPEKLNQDAIEQIINQENQLFLSVGSTWEIAIKVSIGKLPLPEPVDIYTASRMRLMGAKHLDILYSHACRISSLPLIHRDPFDRLLIAQALVENVTLVTAEEILQQYDVSLLWAKA
jgi:PIN domain nuclease of toxin-antitoxin system